MSTSPYVPRPVITFTHLYPKLLDEHNDMIESARLLDVVLVELEHLSEAFLLYDTNNGQYPLPKKGEFLKLTFLKPAECPGICATNLFTTLRRYTPAKQRYYQSCLGKIFELALKE